MLEKKPLITHIYTADPSAHVFNGKIYIYPSHDKGIDVESNDNGDQYQMEDYHVFEMPDTETLPRDCGLALHQDDVKWVSSQLWAPDCAEKDGKYYLIFPARDKKNFFRLGIATSDKPEGPFKPEDEPIKGSYSIDPCMFKDDDGEYYTAFGGIWGGQLDKYRNNVYDEKNKEPEGDTPAVCGKIAKMTADLKQFAEEPRDIVVLDENGEPLKGKDHDRRYFEAPWIFKRNGKYYFTYSTGDTHFIIWTVADNVYGPYTYGGKVLTPPLGWTTHHSIVEFKGKWYLFYHDCELSGGVNQKRNVKFCSLEFRADGSIVTQTPM
ncbi:MAG: glycoside hydrolase family 43 protein [Spirochaetaceae bacterium]|nr:glycoside hydrolase family 43 protein [Spirochaetaceae bacterium]